MALVSNMEEIVKDIGKLKQVETAPSSTLCKAATKLYKLFEKAKKCKTGKGSVSPG